MSWQENPYQSPGAASMAVPAALAEQWERAAFIRRTYAHLAGAILLFVLIEAAIFALVPEQTLATITFQLAGPWTWLAFLGAFMVVSWIARWWASSETSVGLQYFGLLTYVVAEAVLFVPLLFVAKEYCRDQNLIPSAGLITLLTFGGLTAVTFITRADFSFLKMVLVAGGMAALGLIVCAAIFQGLSLGIWFSVAMIALASGYILYDTSNVLHHYRTDQHVAASLALFASVALLFWYVLRLMIAMQRR